MNGIGRLVRPLVAVGALAGLVACGAGKGLSPASEGSAGKSTSLDGDVLVLTWDAYKAYGVTSFEIYAAEKGDSKGKKLVSVAADGEDFDAKVPSVSLSLDEHDELQTDGTVCLWLVAAGADDRRSAPGERACIDL